MGYVWRSMPVRHWDVECTSSKQEAKLWELMLLRGFAFFVVVQMGNEEGIGMARFALWGFG